MQVESRQCGDRSNCPVNAIVEIIGDQWSLLVLRDMLLMLRTRFSEFSASDEGVATNILTSRLSKLVSHGVIEKIPDPSDGRASIYLPTELARDMIPVLLAAIDWSDKHQSDADKHPDLMQLYRADPHKAAAMVAERARTFAEEIKQ